MNLLGTGFLTPEGLAEAKRVEAGIAVELAIAKRAIAVCQAALTGADISAQETDKQKQLLVACVMLTRILEISEGMVLLAQGGFSVDVTAALRNFLAAFFIFGNVCKDSTFVARYFRSDLRVRQKLVNAAAKHQGEPFELVNKYASPEVRKELDEQISEMKATEFDSYKYANDVGCTHLYDSMYRISSAATHSTPRSLEDYVREDERGNVVQLVRQPQAGDIADRILDVSALLLNVRTAFDALSGLDAGGEVDEIRALLESIPSRAVPLTSLDQRSVDDAKSDSEATPRG